MTARQLIYFDGETLTRQRRYRKFDATDLSGRVEFNGEASSWNWVHHLLLGVDAYDYDIAKIQRVWRSVPASGDRTYSINLYTPIYGSTPPELHSFWDLQEREKAIGLYAQDQFDISEQWQGLVGFRFDKLNTEIEDVLANDGRRQSHDEISPRMGVLYQATPSYSFYLSYSEGFRLNSGASAAGEVFEPERSQSYEVGFKLASDDDSIKSNIAIFRAKKSNILTADPVNTGFSLTLGEAESQGLDFDFEVAVGGENTLFFTYAYVDAHTSNDTINPDWDVEIPSGSRLLNIPKHQVNFTVIHTQNLAGHDVNLGASIIYVGERLGETIDPDYTLPSYTTVRMFSSFAVTKRIQLGLEINNLFDKEYFPNSYSALWTQPGSPRTARLKVNYDVF